MMSEARRVASLVVAGVLALLLLAPVSATAQPVGLTLRIEKVLTGDVPPSAERFTFALTALDGGPLPDDPTLVIEGEGAGTLSIDYSRPGTFHYQLRENAGTAEGYTYDDTVYDVTVVVTSDGSGALSVAAVLSKDGGATKEPGIVFENAYSDGGGSDQPDSPDGPDDPDDPGDPDGPGDPGDGDNPDEPGDPNLPEAPGGSGGSLPFSGDVTLPIALIAAMGGAALLAVRRLRTPER